MLERGGLLLCPWEVDERAARAHRTILDLYTRQCLGALRPTSNDRDWSAWFRRRRFEVVETADASLLLLLIAPWRWWLPSCWEVFDAEEQFICGVRRTVLFDGSGRVRGLIVPSVRPNRLSFVRSDDRLLATAVLASEGDQLLFTETVENDPYAKMALLGATLALGEKRRDRRESHTVKPGNRTLES